VIAERNCQSAGFGYVAPNKERPMSTRILKTLKFRVPTQHRNQLVEVTERIGELLKKESVDDAVVVVYSPHTTAGVCIQENADPDVKTDLLAKLEAMIPKSEGYYRHAEGNSDSHLKTVLTGNSVNLLVESGKLLLGQWQGVYLCEFDGPRERELWVKVFHDRSGASGRW
jgi:secondary thiamine-phosphate synthase enzyme